MKGCLLLGYVANHNTMESGLSVVAFLKRTNDEIFEMKQDETSRAESVQTRTQRESKRNQKKKPRTSPTTFDETLKLMATYVMAIKALFGNYCTHFRQVMTPRKSLSALEERVEVLSATTYAVLIRAMLEDGCQFFSTIVSRDDFNGDVLATDAKPEADLFDTCRMLRITLPIKPATFPVQWDSRVNSERQESRGGFQGGDY